MKILLYNAIDKGGAYQALLKYANLLTSNGNDVEIVIGTKINQFRLKRILVKCIYKILYTIFLQNKKKLRSIQFFNTGIGKYIDKKNADLIVFFWVSDTISLDEIQNLTKSWLWRQSDQNLALVASHYEFDGNKFKLNLINEYITNYKNKFILKNHLRLFAPSSKVGDLIRDKVGMEIAQLLTPPDDLLLDKSQRILNSYQVEYSSDIKIELKKTLSFGFVCSSIDDAHRKNFNDAKKIIELMNTHINVSMIHIGEGNLNQLSQYIIDQGYVDGGIQLYDLYSKLDAMLIVSIEDNLPQVLLESLMLGIPIIAKRSKGVVEFLKSNFNAYIIDDLDNFDGKDLLMFIEKFKSDLRYDSINESMQLFDNKKIYDKFIEIHDGIK